MNPVLRRVLHWALNVVLYVVCLGLILLALFGQPGDTSEAHFARFMTMLTGIAFGVFAFFFTRYTIRKG